MYIDDNAAVKDEKSLEIPLAPILLIVVAALLFGVALGWSFAKSSTAGDCERLGGFYHGVLVFECKKIDRVERP